MEYWNQCLQRSKLVRSLCLKIILLAALLGSAANAALAQANNRADLDGYWVRLWHDPAVAKGLVVYKFEYLKLNGKEIENGYGSTGYPDQTYCMDWPKQACMGARNAVQSEGNFSFGNNTILVSDYRAVNSLIDRTAEDWLYYRPHALMAQCCDIEFNVDGSTATLIRDSETRTYLRFSEIEFSALRTFISMIEMSAMQYGTCIMRGTHNALLAQQRGEPQELDHKILANLRLATFVDSILAEEAIYTANGTIDTVALRSRSDELGARYNAVYGRKALANMIIAITTEPGDTVKDAFENVGPALLKGKDDQLKTALFIAEILELENDIKVFNSFVKAVRESEKEALTNLYCPSMQLPILH